MTDEIKNGELRGPGEAPEEQAGAQPYEPPKVIRVNLRPEEAVLGHCKISGSAGPASGSCTVPGCFVPGS
ncbi:MAG: hypothetical protein ACRD4R_01155 [Candidatus Acidiferrales bacterium]